MRSVWFAIPTPALHMHARLASSRSTRPRRMAPEQETACAPSQKSVDMDDVGFYGWGNKAIVTIARDHLYTGPNL